MREQRKVVTVLFADVVGSTEIAADRDPEVVRALMARYFKQVGEIAAAYGGTVEKFAGDAAMVVFGVPTVHDDDAERAVRAALEIRDRAGEVAVRVGVNTGEAVTAPTDDRQFMVSGDAVNVAARLQQGADAGEVVVGHLTQQLTRNAIEYQARVPVSAKGKAEPLTAYRAVKARTQVPQQARGVPGLQAALVGRTRELRLLLDTFARAAEDRTPHLFTIVGAAGIGKSRLVNEALGALADSGARVLRGRCLPYGRGITYWPLVEMLRQDTGIGLEDERESAANKLDRWLGELLSDDPLRPALRARLAVMLGLETAESVMPDTPTDRVEREIAWAVRHYVAAVARAAPLIVVIDDLQWAEPPLLAMIEELAERMTDVPMILVGVARPEFLESHVGWSAGKPNASTITLDPLNPQETATLISRLLEIEALPSDLRAQIIERSAGTPLFCEEFLHMLIDDGRLVREDGSWKAIVAVEQVEVPQTITAVLSARLDGLPEVERNVLQAASVIGQRFALSEVQDLIGNLEAEAALESLRRKGLVVFGERSGDELRFRHLLIRDAAYASLPKSQRAALHDRFGAALEAEAGDPEQFTEILAHHAERAFTLSKELAMEGELLAARAHRALEWSLTMADRARTRHDLQILEAALQIARSAASTLPDGGGLGLRARIRLLEAQAMVIRADYAGARHASSEAASLGEQGNLLGLVATARLTEAWISNFSRAGEIEEFDHVAQAAVEAARHAGDVSSEIEARHLQTNILFEVGRLDEFFNVNRQLLDQARSVGDAAHEAVILERMSNVEQLRGNPEIAEQYARAAEELANRLGLRNIALGVMRNRAHKLLFKGDFHAALRSYQQLLAAADDAGAVLMQVVALRFMGYALRYQHRYLEMAHALDQALELSESSGERWNRTELLALRARAALELGDTVEAERFIQGALATLRDTDVTATSEVYDHLGVLRSVQGRDADAEGALRHSIEVVANTHYLWAHAHGIADLAKFLAQRGRDLEATSLVAELEEAAAARGWGMLRAWANEVKALIETGAEADRT